MIMGDTFSEIVEKHTTNINRTPNSPASTQPASLFKRIHDPHASSGKVAGVARGKCETVMKRGGGDHPIEQRQHLAFALQFHHQSRPAQAHSG